MHLEITNRQKMKGIKIISYKISKFFIFPSKS